MRHARLVLATAMLCAVPSAASAQQVTSMLLSEGVKAYQGLDFAAAAQLLRRALDTDGSLAPADRHRALMYLGAAHVFRDEHSDAVDAFRALVLEDPRFRPDTLIFPPRVTQVYTEVLQTTKAVALEAPVDARFRARAETFNVRAYATSPHQNHARIETADGRLLAPLYSGRIADSVTLSWGGLDAAGAVAGTGSYRLVVTSLVADQVLRSVSLPLEVRVEPPDTLPWPPASSVRRSGWDPRFLIPGLVLGVGFAVPAALGAGGAQGPRIALGLVFSTIGVIGAVRGGGRASPAAEAAWRHHVDVVRAENARRRREPMITLHTGAPIRSEAGSS